MMFQAYSGLRMFTYSPPSDVGTLLNVPCCNRNVTDIICMYFVQCYIFPMNWCTNNQAKAKATPSHVVVLVYVTLTQINILVKETACPDLFTLLFTVLIRLGLKSSLFAFVTWLFIVLNPWTNPLLCKAGVLWHPLTWGTVPKEDVCCGPCADEQPGNNSI